jgi:hypothetical protein
MITGRATSGDACCYCEHERLLEEHERRVEMGGGRVEDIIPLADSPHHGNAR